MCVKEGWLHKQGGGSSFLGRKNWKKRYFVLKPGVLRYFKGSSKTNLLGEVDFSELVGGDASLAENQLGVGRKHCFAVRSKERNLLLCAADSDDEMSWVKALRETITAFQKYAKGLFVNKSENDQDKTESPTKPDDLDVSPSISVKSFVEDRKDSDADSNRSLVSSTTSVPMEDSTSSVKISPNSLAKQTAKSMANEFMAVAAKRRSRGLTIGHRAIHRNSSTKDEEMTKSEEKCPAEVKVSNTNNWMNDVPPPPGSPSPEPSDSPPPPPPLSPTTSNMSNISIAASTSIKDNKENDNESFGAVETIETIESKCDDSVGTSNQPEKQYRIAIALYNFEGRDDNELSFNENDRILVLSEDDQWYTGSKLGDPSMKIGDFPGNYVKFELSRRLTKSFASMTAALSDARVQEDSSLSQNNSQKSVVAETGETHVTSNPSGICPALDLFIQNNTVVIKSGFLKKRGGGTSTFGKQNWRTRFFVVTGEGVYYFSNEKSVVPKGGILWNDVVEKIDATPKEINRNFAFCITTDGRKMYLAAGNETIHNDWVNDLSKVLDNRYANDRQSLDIDAVSPPPPLPMRVSFRKTAQKTDAGNSVSTISDIKQVVVTPSPSKLVTAPRPTSKRGDGIVSKRLLECAVVSNAEQATAEAAAVCTASKPALSCLEKKGKEVLQWGKLSKRGGGTSTFGKKNWKLRFFVCTVDGLYYFESASKSEPLGKIMWDDLKAAEDGSLIAAVDVSPKACTKKFAFSLKTCKRVLIVSCDTKEVHDTWVDTILKVIKRHTLMKKMSDTGAINLMKHASFLKK